MNDKSFVDKITGIIAIWSNVKKSLIKVYDSMIFYPSVFTLLSLILGIYMVSSTNAGIENFSEKIHVLKITEKNIITILATFLTGLLSIIIFSFSMIMLVLNQAASQYSPKVLNLLLNKKSSQIILASYLGTIIYTIILLLQIPQNFEERPLYQTAVFFNSVFTFFCLILFIKLINDISSDIKVSNIIESIYNETLKKMKKEYPNSDIETIKKDRSKWIDYKSKSTGYLQRVDETSLLDICTNNDIKLKLVYYKDYFYIKNDVLFFVDKEIDDSIINSIYSTLVFYTSEKNEDESFFGFRQLSEIAVKALSPGINDPGTASLCVDYLTDLLIIKMAQPDVIVLNDNKGTERVLIQPESFPDMINVSIIPILHYGGKDIQILKKFLVLLKRLSLHDKEKKFKDYLNTLLIAVLNEVQEKKNNNLFYNYLKETIDELIIHSSGYYSS